MSLLFYFTNSGRYKEISKTRWWLFFSSYAFVWAGVV
jgi:hypothetical protein